MPTIAFVSSKGGVGKTTSALLLALGLAERGLEVALVDSDPNLPLSHWAALPGRPPRIRLFHAENFQDLPAALRSAKAAADWVIVDTEGGAPRMGGLAIANSDLVITPMAASSLEVREAFKTAGLVEAVSRREARKIPLVCLFARTPGGVRRSFNDVSRQLADAGLPVLGVALSDKEAFRALFAHGGTLQALSRSRVSGVAAAGQTVREYADEVHRLLTPAPT